MSSRRLASAWRHTHDCSQQPPCPEARSYCQVRRDDGLSYRDHLEQLTFQLFLKMGDEREKLTGEEQASPKGHRWADLAGAQMQGSSEELHYRETLRLLG